MRMPVYPIAVCMGFSMLLASCAEDALVSYEHFAPKLVVHGQFSPDTTFRFSIASTKTPVDGGAYHIPEHLVVSLVDLTTGSVVNLTQEGGVFTSTAQPSLGRAYKLFVNAQGYPAVEAQTVIPYAVGLRGGEILNLHFEKSDLTPGKMNLLYDLKLDFVPHGHPYFHFRFIQSTRINVGTVTEPDFQQRLYLINPSIPDRDAFYIHHESGVLVDVMRTGTRETLQFSFVDYTLGDFEELGNLYIEVRTVTEDYYLYYSSLARQLISRDDPFAEPIPVFNNVIGGSGNFSAYSRIVYQIPVLP